MSFSLSNRALLRGMLAGVVVLTGTACSRSDRTESGRDNSAAVLPDTSSNAAQPTTSTRSNTPRAKTAPPSDTDVAGYRSMERDTTNVQGQTDTAAIDASVDVADTSSTEMAGAADTVAGTEVPADTAAAGYAEMARDTSTVADQPDTAATPSADVALQATIDTSSQANADVSAEADVAAAETVDEAADETADEQVVRPEDRGTVAASETPTDEVGAAAVGGDVTGAEAVALMSRGGVRCAVVDPEANETVRWDMSNTPVGLNPCGMGSMVLSKIWTRVE